MEALFRHGATEQDTEARRKAIAAFLQIGGVDIRDIPLDALMDKVSLCWIIGWSITCNWLITD